MSRKRPQPPVKPFKKKPNPATPRNPSSKPYLFQYASLR